MIAALIMVAVFVGFAAVSQRSKAPEEDVRVELLASEMKSELSQLVDYSLINNENTTLLIENVTGMYARLHADKDVAVVHGTNASALIIHYKKGVRSSGEDELTITSAAGAAKLTLERGNFSYPIQLTPSYQTFIFVKKERSNEKFVSFS